jgi:hypothetical protein
MLRQRPGEGGFGRPSARGTRHRSASLRSSVSHGIAFPQTTMGSWCGFRVHCRDAGCGALLRGLDRTRSGIGGLTVAMAGSGPGLMTTSPIGRLRSGSGPGRRSTGAARTGPGRPVDGSVPACGGVHETDGNLRVFDATGRAGVLVLDADGRRALLQIACPVDHEHCFRVVQVLDHRGAYVVTDRVGVPLGPSQQVLHAVRSRFTGPLGDRPAVLAQQVRQQPEHQPPHSSPGPGLDPREASRDPVRQTLKRVWPASRFYAVTRGHCVIFSLHTPMINGGRSCLAAAPCQQDHGLQLEYWA